MADLIINFTEKDYYTKDETDIKYVIVGQPSSDADKLGGHDPSYYSTHLDTYTKVESDVNFLAVDSTAVDSYKLNGEDPSYYAPQYDTYTKDEVYNKSETYSKTETDQEISNLINSSPSILQTLQDLDTALNDSTSLYTTCITELSNKVETSDYTPAEILTRLKTVDGSGSGLDADTVDGYHAIEDSKGFDNSIPVRKINGSMDIGRRLNFYTSSTESNPNVIIDVDFPDSINILGVNPINGVKINGGKVWSEFNDGPNSGLDADTIDGIQGDEIALQSDTYTRNELYTKNETYSKSEVYNKTETYNKNELYSKIEAQNLFIFKSTEGVDAETLDGYDSTYYAKEYNTYRKSETDNLLALKVNLADFNPANILDKVKTVDGTGSGLDADRFQGKEPSWFAATNNVYDKTETYSQDEVYNKTETYSQDEVYDKIEADARFAPLGSGSGTIDADTLEGHDSAYFAIASDTYTKADVYTKTEADALFGGGSGGSGGDADTLDGHDSSYFAPNFNVYKKNEIDLFLENKVNTSDYTANEILIKLKTVDGSGSGLDADTVRGEVLGNQSSHNQTISTDAPSGGSPGDVWYKV